MSGPMKGERRNVDLWLIDPDERNPRGKVHGDDAAVQELAASMRVHGQIEPMVVRPHPTIPGRYVNVIGHRRVVALNLAAIDQADVIVREMSADEALEVMTVENKQREPLPPLGEARALAVIVETAGGVPAAAMRVGKSAEHVRGMLSLLELAAPVQGRLAAGRLPLEHALSVARLPPALHEEAANAIELDGGAVLSLRDATHLLRTRFTLRLDTAPFDRGDFDLHPEAGPCTTCPKRTGAQGELFAAAATPDLCLDPGCFGTKRDRAWEARAGAHEEKKLPVYEGKDARKVLENPAYLDLDAPCARDPHSRPWRDVIGKAAKKVPTALVRDPELRVHELVLRTDLAEVKLDTAAMKAIQDDEKAREAARDLELEEKARENRRAAAVARALETVLAGVESGPLLDVFPSGLVTLLQEIAIAAIEVTWPETLKAVGARMGITAKGPELNELLASAVRAFPAGASIAFLCELVLTRVATRGEDPLGQGMPLARVLAACKGPKKSPGAAPPAAEEAPEKAPAGKKGAKVPTSKKAPEKGAPRAKKKGRSQ